MMIDWGTCPSVEHDSEKVSGDDFQWFIQLL